MNCSFRNLELANFTIRSEWLRFRIRIKIYYKTIPSLESYGTPKGHLRFVHCSDVIMNTIASQITGASIVYSIVCSGEDQMKHQTSASLAFVRGIHRWQVNSSHKGPITRKMFPFDDVIMKLKQLQYFLIVDLRISKLGHISISYLGICISWLGLRVT